MITLSGPALSKVNRRDPLYLALADAHPRVAKKDANTWGPAAAKEAAVRLNWVDLDEGSRELLPILDAVAAKFRDYENLVLCGMGGSSLAPEVIAKTYGKEIFILDSTDPDYLAHALTGSPEKLLVIVSSKSGSTIETASQRAFFEDHLRKAKLDPTQHMLFVTDPDSPLDKDVRAKGFTVINADPMVGGRFSALTAFGLTPATLMGVDASILLDQAGDARAQFTSDPSVVLDVAYLLLTQNQQYLGFTDFGSRFPGLSDWIEQLIAESTGKDEKGRLPIATENFSEAEGGGAFSIAFAPGAHLSVSAELGEHFLFWEWVTALMGAALNVDPFNQPNVTEAKEATSAVLAEWDNKLPQLASTSVDEQIEIFGDGLQQRSFLYIDECLDGIRKLMDSEYVYPVNIGSDEMISINDLAKMVIEISGKKLSIKNVSSNALGVRGRNSNNELIYEVTSWRPTQSLKTGMEKLYHWVSAEVNQYKSKSI